MKDDPKTRAEYDAFKRSDFVAKMIADINSRLGFKNESLDLGKDASAVLVMLWFKILFILIAPPPPHHRSFRMESTPYTVQMDEWR